MCPRAAFTASVPLGALTRLGCAGDVLGRVVDDDLVRDEVAPEKWPTTTTGMSGWKSWGGLPVLTRRRVPWCRRPRSRRRRDAVHRSGHHQTLETEGLRPERGLAVPAPGRPSRNSRASCPDPSRAGRRRRRRGRRRPRTGADDRASRTRRTGGDPRRRPRTAVAPVAAAGAAGVVRAAASLTARRSSAPARRRPLESPPATARAGPRTAPGRRAAMP